ncbi:MAG: ATP-binding protein [Bacteroides sp.]|nr:ATP-binding protein [Bacteroides sp.]MCM1549563.1 ATP-binding protein [Clostridium sp.]
MREEEDQFKIPIRITKVAFWILLVFWILFCSLTLFYSQEDFRFTDHNCYSFNQGWVLSDDGTTPVSVPSKLQGEATVVRIQNTIPEAVSNRTTIMVKGLHQDIEVYIDGELVGELNNSESRSYGRHTPSGCVMVPVGLADAGKQIVIQYSALEPETAGQINDIRIGTDIGILFWMLTSYGSDVLFAVLLLYTGFVIVIFGIAVRFVFRENPNVNITYLGVTAICTAVWMIGESRLKQLYYGNLAVGEMLLWEALFIAPIPIMFYVNRLQEGRYSRLYFIGTASALAGNIIMIIFELTNTFDFFQMYRVGWGIILGAGLLIIYTIIRDWMKGKGQWRLLMGIIVLFLCILLQMWAFRYHATGIISNNYISLGLILFLILMGISAVTSMLKQKQEQILAIKENETKSDFLANMSHEIRTPINAILGFDEMLLREENNEQTLEYAANIKSAGENLLSLVNDILDFSKVESGKMEIIPEEYKTSDMLTDVVNLTYLKAQEKGLSFEIYIGKDIPRKLYGDEMRVKQILTNVLNNAVKYTEAGRVILSVNFDKLDAENGRLRISVEDTGIGIEQENISKITESFQRFDLQRNRSIEGSGLGMSIVASLLRVMGGRLQIYSTYGEGSDFRILIPQGIRDASPIGNYQKDFRNGLRNMEPYQELFTAPQATILFVDDNAMNLSVARGLLKKTKIHIDTAESGSRCLELTRQGKYDLIFMDHLMPEMDGVETLHRLRQEEGNPNQNTMVVALTANAIKGSRDFYMQEGFCDYLTKPVAGERLEEVLFKLLPQEYIIPSEEAEAAIEKEEEETEAVISNETNRVISIDVCLQELESMLRQAHISITEGYHYAGNSMGQFHWMLMLFAESFHEKSRRLAGFYEGQEEEAYTIEVHALKSNAKGIGATVLYQLAWEHERQSRAGNWEYVQAHWEELCGEWLCVVNGILSYIGEDPMEWKEAAAAVEPDKPEITAEQRIILKNCIHVLEDYESDPACALLENLLQEELEQGVREILEQALEALERLDFEESSQLLRQI